MAKVRFIIDTEVTDPPPDALEKLSAVVRKEIRFMLGNSAELVAAQWVTSDVDLKAIVEAMRPNEFKCFARDSTWGGGPFIEDFDGKRRFWRKATHQEITSATAEEMRLMLPSVPAGALVEDRVHWSEERRGGDTHA